MNKHLLLLSFAALSFTTAAQDRGLLSGTLSIATTRISDDGPKSTSVTVGPVVGLNLNERIVLGAGLSYTSERSERTVAFTDQTTLMVFDESESTSLFKVSPFMRYMKKVNDDFLLYGQAKVGVGFGRRTSEEVFSGLLVKTESDLSTFDMGVGPGIVYVFAPHWAVNADWGLVGYSSVTEKFDLGSAEVKSTTSGFEFTLDPGAITFGLNWLF